MTGADSTSAESPDRRDAPVDLWRLPRIVRVESRVARYSPPRARYEGRERIEYDAAVEVRVHTDGPIPSRAITPVLVVGGVELQEFATDADGGYVFYAFEPDRLDDGAAVAFRWPTGPDTKPQPSAARFTMPTEAASS